MRKVLFIFGQLTDLDVEHLAKLGARERIPAGTILIEEGKTSENIYLVLEGTLSVVQKWRGNLEVARLMTGEIVGEMSFIDAAPPAATVKASEDSLVLKISRDKLKSLLDADMGFAARFYRAIAIFLSDRLRSMMMGSDGGQSPSGLDADELDPNALTGITLAGDRFDRMLKRLRGQ